MKTPVRTRLLSALLSLVMLVSLLPVSVFAAEPASGTWEKVTEAQEDWSGQYLIVYEKGSLIMDGSLSALDKEGNKVDVTITDGKIVGDYAKYAFTIAPMTGGWSVQSASGKYISGKSGSNKIITGSTPELNTITFADGNVKIASNNTTLQYNAAATNGTRFRYYKSENQQPVALYKLSTVPARESGIVTDLTTLQNGDKVVVFNPANKKALSSVYNGFYNTGVDVELTGGKLTGYTNAELWTVNRTESGAYTFSTADGKKLSMDEKYSSTPLDKTHTGWSILPAATENCVYIQNVGRSSYLEWYAEKNNWSAFGTIGSNEALFAQQLYLVGDETDQPAGSLPQEGAQVVLFNQNAQGVLAGQNDNTDSPAINSVSAQITDGKAIPGNGGVVFTVERSGEYYRFRNETYGYLCSNGTGNNAFYSLTASDDADWTVEPCSGGVGGYQLESRTAKFNGRYSQFLEYYSDSYKTYSMYNVTDYTIYSFFFYGVADSVKLDGGIVNDPAVKFTSADSVKGGQDYTLTFTVDDAKAVQKLEILVDGRSAGVITDYTADGSNYTANVPAAMLAGSDQVTFTVRVTNVSGVSYSGSLVVTDRSKNNVTILAPTAFTRTVDEAVQTMNDGEYERSLTLWEDVLSQCSNYDYARIAIARIHIQLGNYEDAASLMKIGEKRYYSDIFEYRRDNWIRQNILWLLGAAAVLAAVIVTVRLLVKKRRTAAAGAPNPLVQELRYGTHVIFHPFDGFWDLKREKRGSVRAGGILFAAFLLCYAIQRQFTGYLFNSDPLGEKSVFLDVITVVVLFALWCIANWCFTTLMDGEGTLADIFVSSAYALVPYILAFPLMMFLSYFLSVNEADFYGVLSAIVVIWVALLLFFGMMVTHDYSLRKAVLSLVLTVVGILLVIFLGFLFINLIQQCWVFISRIYQELAFRLY